MKTLVTGATGLIGRYLLGSIENPVVLSRRPNEARRLFGAIETHVWEPEAGPPQSEEQLNHGPASDGTPQTPLA